MRGTRIKIVLTIFTNGPWVETSSEMCLAKRWANLHLEKIGINSGLERKEY